jgi:hypothetical protein
MAMFAQPQRYAGSAISMMGGAPRPYAPQQAQATWPQSPPPPALWQSPDRVAPPSPRQQSNLQSPFPGSF